LTKKKRKIGVSLVFVALIQILLGLLIVYGGITLFAFSANSIEQTLAIVLGTLLLGSGLMTIGLSKRFF
jgi:hypothetical protein